MSLLEQSLYLWLKELAKVVEYLHVIIAKEDRKALKDKSRHRLNNIEWHLLDASKDKYPLHEKILLDAPCSGTGVIGRRPDIKWRLRKSDIKNGKSSKIHIEKYFKLFKTWW